MTTTIIDTTGTESTQTTAGITWTKTVYPSYRNYRSETFFVGQTPSNAWALWAVTADGFARRGEGFSKPELAMAYAATLTEEIPAPAKRARPAFENTPFGFES
jgi:hypothetical protein